MVEEMTDREKMEFVFGVHEDEPVVVDWDKSVARQLALLEGIQLGEEHWEVVSFLRKHFNNVGELDYARDISAMLKQRYETQGGLQYLYRLFPNGPVSQGCKIAGIPVPNDSKNPSFGNIA